MVACLRECGDGVVLPTRLGQSITVRVGNSVVRNHIRRRVREVYRLTLESLPPGWDFVVIPKTSAASADYAQIESDLRECWKRLLPPRT